MNTMYWWIAIGIGVVIVAWIVWQARKPGARRRAAVRHAIEQAERAATDANDLDAQVRLAGVYLDLAGEPNKALDILGRVVEEQEIHWTGEGPPTRFMLAHAHVQSGDLDKAIEQFTVFVESASKYATGDDKERKFLLHTHKVDAEQRIRLLKRGDTHIHQPEKWGDSD